MGVRGVSRQLNQCGCVYGAFPALELMGYFAQSCGSRLLYPGTCAKPELASHRVYGSFCGVLFVFIYYTLYIRTSPAREASQPIAGLLPRAADFGSVEC